MAEYNKERVARMVSDIAETLEGREASPNEVYIALGHVISMMDDG